MQLKKKLGVYIIISLFIPSLAFAQNKQVKKSPNEIGVGNIRLPLDPQVRTGRLANGFTYFIRKNIHPKERVIFYLANKVGSIMENDDQRGLAHFMEHMNFNGTTHFPKNELVNYLQKVGVRFGADINAYTSFDETVYQLPLPSNDPEILKNGIQIMYDWAHEALLDPSEIDKERGVILEEKRLGKGAQERMQRQYLPLLFNQSRYSKRLPIGVDTIINNFTAKTLNQFYQDWYRPNLQALIIVGDINVDEMEKTVKEKFSHLTSPVTERNRTEYTIKLTGKNQFVAVTDKEMPQTMIEVMIKHPGVSIKTESDYRDYIARALFNNMLSDRYNELSEKENVPFINGTASINTFLGGLNAYNVLIMTKPGEIENGFKAAWLETERLKRYGFTQKELLRAKNNYLKRIESSLKKKNTTYSPNLVKEYLDYFLKDIAAPGIDAEYQLAKKALPQIRLQMLNSLSKSYIKDTDRDIIITAPENEKSNLPSDNTILQWMADVKKQNIAPYQDDFIDLPLLSEKPAGGKIVKQQTLAGIGATELILSNGAKVILKPTKFFENELLFKAFSPGGSSLNSDTDYLSAAFASYMATKAKLGSYDYNNLNKYLAGSNIILGPYINNYSEGLDGAASTDEVETLLQMTYLYFTQPQTDSASFNNLIAQTKASLVNAKENPTSVFNDTVSAVMGNYHIRRTPLTAVKVDQIDLQRGHEIFKERFANASDFTFSFVGDFDPDKIKPLIERYLGSLRSTHAQSEKPKDLGIHPPAGNISKTVYKGLESKATVRLIFHGEYNYSPANNLGLDALAEILQIKLTERLREEESGVYSPSVNIGYSKVPDQRYNIVISFGCAPENVEKLIASALDEVQKLKTSNSEEVNIEKFRAETRRTHETNLRKNDFWSMYITDQILNNEDINQIKSFDEELNRLDGKRLKEAANIYLNNSRFIRLVLLPEDKK